jgi:transposase InsO family protein
LEKESGVKAGEFAALWGVSLSTHWRWVGGRFKDAVGRARRVTKEVRAKILEIDRENRSTWDTRSIASVVGVSHGSVAKVLAESRSPRPTRKALPHTGRTKIMARDVFWSSDFTEVPGKRKLLKTLDEHSRYRPGWDICPETAEAVVEHAEGLVRCMGRAPLVWKYDHGSAFTSERFQAFLRRHWIIGYPTQRRAPWTNGRTERDNREIKNWLIPVKDEVSDSELEREVREGMLMLNNLKPRAVLGYETSAGVYHKCSGVEHLDRPAILRMLEEIKRGLAPLKGERLHRKAVRELLKQLELYEEWEVGGTAESVNRIGQANASI